MEPEDSLRMGDEHLDTIPETKSDEFIKSSVENLVLNPSESEDDSECDVPACDDFRTFSNLLFDADDDFSSSDNEPFSNEYILKEIYLNPLFDEEIISIKIDPHRFNAESDLIESLLNHDSSIISSSLKIDSLLDEFASELILLKSIAPGIDEVDCDLEEEVRLIENLLNDISSPQRAEGNGNGNNEIQIRCYNYQGVGHYARHYTVRPRRMEFDFMAAVGTCEEIEEVNANYTLIENLQQPSTSGTQTDKAPVYDSDGSAENDGNVILAESSMDPSGETVEQHPATVEEPRAFLSHYIIIWSWKLRK
uniref:Reverse transcriptase domain-containing protein n=1 Tax=Tanacetum cinerariifolium TaxID=118510 RepID=A0A6L2NIN0_TANCI|nr:hypothetical protein [Tanacetum cinerariifolium]